jgi:hypothetical protein
MIYPIFRRFLGFLHQHPLISFVTKRSGYNLENSGGQGGQGQSWQLEDKKAMRRVPRSVNPITVGTLGSFGGGSEERIIQRDGEGSGELGKDVEVGISVTREVEIDSEHGGREGNMYGHYLDGKGGVGKGV